MNDLLEQLREAWSAARSGEAAVVHITSGIGFGRTTCLTRFLEVVDTPGHSAVVVAANCAEDANVSSRLGVLEELVVRVAEGVRTIDASADSDSARDDVPWFLPGGEFLATASGVARLPDSADSPPSPSRASIYAELLLDIARERAVLIVLDDAHRADASSRSLVEAIADALAVDANHRLLLVLATARPPRPSPGSSAEPPAPWPTTAHSSFRVIELGPADESAVAAVVERRAGRAPGGAAIARFAADTARGNLRVVEAIVHLAERTGELKRKRTQRVAVGALDAGPELVGLRALAKCELPDIPANVRADFHAAAIIGERIEIGLLARLWQVPVEAARLRAQALVRTGLVEPEGPPQEDVCRFISGELAACFADELPDEARRSLHARIAALLRAEIEALGDEDPIEPHMLIDVTETWSETRRRDRQMRQSFDKLWAAARHFARADCHAEAAEAAVTLGERLFETSGGYSYLAGRHGRREDRERRHRIHVALREAGWQLSLARKVANEGPDPRLLTIDTRLLTVRARFKEVMGDFTRARALADAAVELASYVTDGRLRLLAMRVRTEICYASGDQNAGRQNLADIYDEIALERAPTEDAVRVLGWLAECVGRWEWIGLHDRLFPQLINRLQSLGAERAGIKARIERLAAAAEAEPSADVRDDRFDEVVREARARDQLAYAAELLAAYAAEIIQGVVESHYDTLSGEFYPPDLYGEGVGGQTASVAERLDWPVQLLDRAEELAHECGDRLTTLRVLSTMLGLFYDVRERCGELLERWMPLHREGQPVRLSELVDLLKVGFFSLEHVEEIVEQMILLAQACGLDQVLADTIYEALDHELPSALQRSGTLFEMANKAYERVGDAYGLITLQLVEHRLSSRNRQAAEQVLTSAMRLHDDRGHQLSAEQRAFVAMRFGELLLDESRTDEAVEYLEGASGLYDELGDMERLQSLGELLRNVYREHGDFGRYRNIRERIRALEDRTPGVDPLGLELRIEHLLTLARQESDEERAIEMVERCVRLFGRMPDGTTRIDECFVEISKICRRRADDTQTEAGLHDWLRRSMAAVETATSINRSLSNYHRLFEEYHELFDDLLGLGDYDAYLGARAESRELAFAVGHVGELQYLFDEHVHIDLDAGFDRGRLLEVRGFYEALARYLLGLGAHSQAVALKRSFVGFLTAVGEPEMATIYRMRAPFEADEQLLA